MINLISGSLRKFLKDDRYKDEIESFFSFYDELRFENNIAVIYKRLNKWIFENYEIKSFRIDIISIKNKQKEKAFLSDSSVDFSIPNELLKEYKVEMNSKLIVAFSFICKDKQQYIDLNEKDEYLKSLFYMITPLLSLLSYDEMLKDLTLRDIVTNTYNRKFLTEHSNKLLPLAKREKKNLSFLMIGIDHFQAVIDEFDYEIGDKLLQSLANILKENVRESDLVIKMNSDQFLVTLVGITNKEDAFIVAKKLVEAFAKSELKIDDYGSVLKKTICIGLTHYDFETLSIESILRTADISLYEARNEGRGVIKEYNPKDELGVDLF